jgi:hypothetical protein
LLLEGHKHKDEEIEGKQFPADSVNVPAYMKMMGLIRGKGSEADLESMVKGLPKERADWFRHQYATNWAKTKEVAAACTEARRKRAFEATGKDPRKKTKVDEGSTSAETNEMEEEGEDEEGEEDSDA